jgi:uncharacterized protein YegJ (DUF2314 family)
MMFSAFNQGAWMKQLSLLLIVFALGCGRGKVKDTIVMFKEDDPAMNAAMEQARASVRRDFIPVLKKPAPGCVAFSVKVAIKDGDKVEVMWLSNPTLEGDKFTGRIGNEPGIVKNVKLGQTYSVPVDEIADWMYIENKRLVGGYTMRVMRDKMSPKERAEFDKAMPFTVD